MNNYIFVPQFINVLYGTFHLPTPTLLLMGQLILLYCYKVIIYIHLTFLGNQNLHLWMLLLNAGNKKKYQMPDFSLLQESDWCVKNQWCGAMEVFWAAYLEAFNHIGQAKCWVLWFTNKLICTMVAVCLEISHIFSLKLLCNLVTFTECHRWRSNGCFGLELNW